MGVPQGNGQENGNNLLIEGLGLSGPRFTLSLFTELMSVRVGRVYAGCVRPPALGQFVVKGLNLSYHIGDIIHELPFNDLV